LATSTPQLWLGRQTSRGLALLVALLLVLLPARAQTEEDMAEPVELQLEVRVKGYPLNLIAAFTQFPDGELASPRSELEELGVNPPGDGAPEDLVMLKDVAGLSYVYDESSQSIDFELPDSSRIAKSINGGKGDLLEPTPTGNGLVLNYDASVAAERPSMAPT
jgi:outer membrane usher protein FimD/PapC